MKRIILCLSAVALSAVVSGCTAGNGPFYVAAIRPLDAECNFQADRGISGFQLIDVAADPDVYVAVEIGGFSDFSETLTQPPLVVNGRRLTAPQRDRALIQSVVLRYSSRPAIPGFNASVVDTMPLAIPVNPQTEEVVISTPIFGPNARTRFRDMPSANSDVFAFTVTLEFQGVTEPSNSAFRTTPVAFPIRELTKSEIACPNPADTRMNRYVNGLFCNYIGNGQRVTNTDCCGLTSVSDVDVSRPGCDKPL